MVPTPPTPPPAPRVACCPLRFTVLQAGSIMPPPMYGQAPLKVLPSAPPLPAHGTALACACIRWLCACFCIQAYGSVRPVAARHAERRVHTEPNNTHARTHAHRHTHTHTHTQHSCRPQHGTTTTTAAGGTQHTCSSLKTAHPGLLYPRRSLCRPSSPCPSRTPTTQTHWRGWWRGRSGSRSGAWHGRECAGRRAGESGGRRRSSEPNHYIRCSVVRSGRDVCGPCLRFLFYFPFFICLVHTGLRRQKRP